MIGSLIIVSAPSGAGKTTLLNCLLGLDVADYGTVSRAPTCRIGYVPQQFHIQPMMPINVKRFLQLYGTLDEALIDKMQVRHLLEQRMQALSGGEMRRVLLLRALLSRPQLLVLDEPTAGVDVALRHQLWELLKKLNREGTTIILTTHYLEEAESLCRNIAIINGGRIAARERQVHAVGAERTGGVDHAVAVHLVAGHLLEAHHAAAGGGGVA